MKRHAAKKLLAIGFLGALTGLAGPNLAMAADAHDHGHGSATLELNAGAKWQTDAALREGMMRIRASVEKALPEVHAGSYSAPRYQALGDAVEKQVAYIVKNCKLTPQADEVLHKVIAEFSEGADVVRGRKAGADRGAGVVQLVMALDSYGAYFDHAGWKPVETGH